MYSLDSRIRYSEVGPDQCLTLPALVNYFQDCSTFQSEDLGRGVAYLEERKKAWLMCYWQILIDRYPMLGEEVKVETKAYAFDRFYGRRNFAMKDASGAYAVRADSVWFFYNAETGRPERPEEEDVAPYGQYEPLPMPYSDTKKVILPEQMEDLEPFPVRRINLDNNYHVNNGQYIRMAFEYLPADRPIVEMRAEYKLAAKLGDMVYPRVGQREEWTVAALCSEEGKPYAVVEARVPDRQDGGQE